MANIVRKGYGQVEPNHLSGIVTGQIYAQLPAVNITTTGEGANAVTTETPIAQLEQGQFAKYNYAEGVVDFGSQDGEFMLVYNEEKLYDERRQAHKDFVYKATDFTDGKLYPRLIKTNVGDIYTTNCIAVANTDADAEVTIGTDATLVVGAYLAPSASTGFLTVGAKPASGMAWKIVKVYTMPDGQPGFKLQRVQ